MNIWQTNALNYATVEVDGHLYDVHFRYFGSDSYFIESVYELATIDVHYNLMEDLDTWFVSKVVEELIVLERE